MSQVEDMEKAKDLIRENKIARIIHSKLELTDHFVVTGNKDDYLVILPDYCSCTHFHINCIKSPGKICKHILACKLVGTKVRELQLDNWQDLLFRDH